MYFDEWSPELVAALEEPFAPGDHKDKTQGGTSITFVDVHKYKERLNATVGPHGWSCTVRLEPIGGKLIATVALTVLGVTKENVGDEVEVPEKNAKGNEKIIGGPATNSYAQAFKRSCSDFGLGAYLYDEAKRNAAKRGAGGSTRQSGNGNRAPEAASEAQTKMIGAKYGQLRDLLPEEHREWARGMIERGFTKKTASDMIEWLTKAEKQYKPEPAGSA